MIGSDKNLTELSYTEGIRKYCYQYVLKRKKGSPEESIDTPKRYVIYARKSTEDEGRQVQSIEDQIERCIQYAEKNNLQIVSEPIRESKSAKIAGRRDQFNVMIERLKKGDLYNSILSWHPDRLARNMKESGEILDMLDNGIIQDLQFVSFFFSNDVSGKLMLNIQFAMAKEFSDKLSVDTIRGIEKKVDSGKYCGSTKRGYYSNENDFFRKSESFHLYKKCWSMYIEGKSQKAIKEFLRENGESISSGALSNFFQDPFYAGMYCYGKKVVNLRDADPKFEPQVSFKDFLLIQKITRPQSIGWRKSLEEKPFYDIIKCKYCESLMLPGVSAGQSTRYLSVICGNGKCREKRRLNGIKPIANTIRGKEIINFTIKFLEESLKVEKKLYEDVKKVYLENSNKIVAQTKKEINILKAKLGRLEAKQKDYTDKLLSYENKEISSVLAGNVQSLMREQDETKSKIAELEIIISKTEYDTSIDFPSYEEFVNFFENLINIMNSTDDYMVYDQIVKMLFVNITVGDKKIVTAKVREPFNTYSNLKFLSGVM